MTQRPNILFCIADDQSWPHASAYGCPWVTNPEQEQRVKKRFRIAKEKGIFFKSN